MILNHLVGGLMSKFFKLLFLTTFLFFSSGVYAYEFEMKFSGTKEQCINVLSKGKLINKLIRTEKTEPYQNDFETNQISYSWYIYKDEIYAFTMSTYRGPDSKKIYCYISK